ncbi:MAG: hypothetical protein ABJF11_11820 [Reichenbachiella sp.]|uniref:hypothetical protein n=1 Tax=Reichenbachiella sp. TaxID=2184521 RepID=UPI0032657633
MKSLVRLCIGFVIIISSQKIVVAQYSLAVNSSTFTLDEQKFEGYSTSFEQPFKEVKKEWWRYANSHSVIFNKKTHLVLTIPADKRESNSPLKFVSQFIENKNGKTSVLRLALMTDEIPEDQVSDLKIQARNLLKDFKVKYFTRKIQERIKNEEAESKKVSITMDKYLLHNSRLQQWIERKPEEKDKFIEKLAANTKEVEDLQKKLNNRQAELTQLKHELTLIK